MDQQQKWCLLGALAVLFLAVIVVFLPKKSFQISHGNSSSNPESAAEKEPSSASASSSSSSAPPMEYEVFLSFRGPDVRANFVDFLYRDLDRSKIRTFLDDVELRKGEEIAPSLVKAIEESKVYIPILSQNYASSKWCLRELALMVKCRNQGNGHIILPIFYMMAPRDVRHQEGSYKEAFRQHAKRYKMETVNEWKDALGEVGNMKGWHVTESDGQGAIIGKVFTEVWSHLMSNYMLVTDELIGIESHVEKVTKLLSSDSEGVRIVGIHGMGGIGKTTIAKAVYNGIFGQFDRFCFLEDAREVLSKSNGVVTLQSMLISSILRTDYNVKDASEGLRVIKDRVCRHKVLVVLDNVNDSFEFEKILGKWDDFSSGSRFIVTTRDKRILQVLQECKLYEPGLMNHEHALELFCKHAFGTDKPPEGEGVLSMEFVKAAAGLPLALKVIGSLLFRRERKFREAKLIEFKDIPPEKLQERLKVSYNDLSRTERRIFLDIASSFIGEKRDLPSYMWNDCRLYPEGGISTLMLRSLVRFNERNEFLMHDHIRDLGRAVIQEENYQHPWKRSRIWSNEDALDMLRDEEGSDQVEVLRVNMEEETLELTDEQFKKLTGLRYLEVFSGRLTGDFKGVLPNLRWLKLHNCSSIPSDLNMKKLVILDMHDCPVNDDWNAWTGIQAAQKLKAVSLSFCGALRTAPDLSQCRTLESIHFWNCWEMVGELHIGNFKSLKLLSLTMTKITKLTGKIRMLKNLEEIDAVHLRELPSGIDRLSSLKILTLTLKELAILPTSLKKLSLSSSQVPNLSELTDLEELSFDRCDQLQLPADIWKLSKLKTLKIWDSSCSNSLLAEESSTVSSLPSSLNSLLIRGCQHLERLPSFANLVNLTELKLIRIQVHEIQGLGNLRLLENLVISAAPNLITLNGLENLFRLTTLTVENCPMLEKLPSISKLENLHTVEITSCQVLSEIQDLDQPGNLSLSSLSIIDCPGFDGFGSLWKLVTLKTLRLYPFETLQFLDLSDLQNMEQLSIFGCTRLTKVNGFDKLKLLKSLSLSDCTSMKELPDLSGLKNLKYLNIDGCTQLVDIKGLEELVALEMLDMSGCTSVTKLPDVSGLKHLEKLVLDDCTQLSDVASLERSVSLRSISMINCVSVTKFPDLSGLTKLDSLQISGCTGLTEVTGIESLESLEVLNMSGCSLLTELPDLCELAKITSLDVSECKQLVDVMGIENLESLHELKMTNCVSIQKLPDLSGFTNLRELDISGCLQLGDVSGIEKLDRLTVSR
ncbi:Disease resistance protein L6 [Linum grandiflorum]